MFHRRKVQFISHRSASGTRNIRPTLKAGSIQEVNCGIYVCVSSHIHILGMVQLSLFLSLSLFIPQRVEIIYMVAIFSFQASARLLIIIMIPSPSHTTRRGVHPFFKNHDRLSLYSFACDTNTHERECDEWMNESSSSLPNPPFPGLVSLPWDVCRSHSLPPLTWMKHKLPRFPVPRWCLFSGADKPFTEPYNCRGMDRKILERICSVHDAHFVQ